MTYKCKNCGTIFTDDVYHYVDISEFEYQAFICTKCGNILLDTEYMECDSCGEDEFYGACPVCFRKKDFNDCID